MKVEELLKKLSEFPEQREELISGVVGTVVLATDGGYKEVGYGFDEMMKLSYELYGDRVTKEKWLDCIEAHLMKMPEGFEADFRVVLLDIEYAKAYVPMKFVLKDFKLPEIRYVNILEEPEREIPPYRPKMKPFDKRRNFKPKNFWNRIRSRCK